jgi:hypothetical protein
MTVMLLPPKKWTQLHRWMWATLGIIGIAVAIVDGIRR